MPELLGNMTQVEFARRIEVSESYVSKIISGEKHLSLEKAATGAFVLGIHAEDFYEWIHAPKSKR